MKVIFDVCYLPFSVAYDRGSGSWVVDRVGVPYMMECPMHYRELTANPQAPPGHYLLALWAVTQASCEVDDPLHRAPGGYIGSAWSLLGYGPFSVGDKLPRRLRSLLYRRYAEQAHRALQAEAALQRLPGYFGYSGEPDPDRLERIINGMFGYTG